MTLWRRLVTLYVFPPVQNRDMKINFIIDLISLYKMPKTHGKHWIIVNYSVSGSDSKDSACNSGHLGLSPGSGRSPGEGKGYLLQYSCLENPMIRGAWQATVHGVAKSLMQIQCQFMAKCYSCYCMAAHNNNIFKRMNNPSTQELRDLYSIPDLPGICVILHLNFLPSKMED